MSIMSAVRYLVLALEIQRISNLTWYKGVGGGEILYEMVRDSRRLGYKSRMLVSLRALRSKYPLGCTRRNNNKRNALICFPLISRVRESGLEVRTGSFLEQWLVIEPIAF